MTRMKSSREFTKQNKKEYIPGDMHDAFQAVSQDMLFIQINLLMTVLSGCFNVERSVTTWKAGLDIFPVLTEGLIQSSYRNIRGLVNPYKDRLSTNQIAVRFGSQTNRTPYDNIIYQPDSRPNIFREKS